jgi:hypothetical protein
MTRVSQIQDRGLERRVTTRNCRPRTPSPGPPREDGGERTSNLRWLQLSLFQEGKCKTNPTARMAGERGLSPPRSRRVLAASVPSPIRRHEDVAATRGAMRRFEALFSAIERFAALSNASRTRCKTKPNVPNRARTPGRACIWIEGGKAGDGKPRRIGID